jgi:hypothetical protein
MEDDVDRDVLSRTDEAGEEAGEEAWRPDPEQPGQERFWDGYEWTDQVRPDGSAPPQAHVPEHTPELQRALAAATADIDAVEDRLSTLFERAGGGGPRPPRSPTTLRGAPEPLGGARADQPDVNSLLPAGRNADDNGQELDDDVVLEDFHEDPEEFEDVDDGRVHPAVDDLDEDDELSDLDAALAAEAPEEF